MKDKHSERMPVLSRPEHRFQQRTKGHWEWCGDRAEHGEVVETWTIGNMRITFPVSKSRHRLGNSLIKAFDVMCEADLEILAMLKAERYARWQRRVNRMRRLGFRWDKASKRFVRMEKAPEPVYFTVSFEGQGGFKWFIDHRGALATWGAMMVFPNKEAAVEHLRSFHSQLLPDANKIIRGHTS
jgi:hypothetical protein